MVNEPVEQDDIGDDFEPFLVSSGYRQLALGLGVPIAGAGVVAVFVSDNQVGTAALFIVAVALLLIAIQGTPIARFGAGENAIQFAAARRRIARELIESGARENDSSAARAYVEAASVVEPRVANGPVARGLIYGADVVEAVGYIADSVAGMPLVEGSVRPDAAAVFGGGEVALEFKYRSGNNPVTWSDVRRLVEAPQWRDQFPLLVVSNNISPDVESQAEQWNAEHPEKPKVGVVQWRNRRDDPALRVALERLRPS